MKRHQKKKDSRIKRKVLTLVFLKTHFSFDFLKDYPTVLFKKKTESLLDTLD